MEEESVSVQNKRELRQTHHSCSSLFDIIRSRHRPVLGAWSAARAITMQIAHIYMRQRAKDSIKAIT